MNRKELFRAVYTELPKTTVTIVSSAVAAVILLATVGVVEFNAMLQERAIVQERIAAYDKAKMEEISKASDAEQWAKDCRAANPLGTDSPANSCDVIQSEPKDTADNNGCFPDGTRWKGNQPGEEVCPVAGLEHKKNVIIAEGEIVKVKPGGYMNWNVNANGEAQAPMIRGIHHIPGMGPTWKACFYCLNEYLDASGFDRRFSLTDGYGAELFKKVGDRYGIKPEVLVCIAQADTSLGKHLLTPYNIGNVGNNDRGHKRGFTSIGAGIDAMGKVLSNKYLGHKQSLGSLTPYGGGNSPFYATSPTGNWYNNVRNCLAEITQDENLGPDFMIRK